MSIDTQSDVITAMIKQSKLIRDLCQGGEHVRACGVAYLPQFPLEEDDDYKTRLAMSRLFNGTKKLIDDMASKVFEKPVTLEETGTSLDEWVQNIDLEGNDLSVFANDVFNAAQRTGISFILVDAPRRDKELTKIQAEQQNIRPYFQHVKLESVLGWRWANINNTPVLTQLRIRESVTEDSGDYDQKAVEQIRVFSLIDGRVQISVHQKATSGWSLVDEYLTDMTKIMLAAHDPGRTGFMQAKPLHSDVAELNLAHYQIGSDLSMGLHKAANPLLFLKGFPIDNESGKSVVKTGSGYAFHASAEHSDMRWVTFTGSGLDATRQQQKDYEYQMQVMGVQLIQSKTGNNTATGDRIDESKSNSRLAMWADNLKDTLELCFGWMAELAGVQAEISVEVNKNYSANALSHLDMQTIGAMFRDSIISRETYYREAMRRGLISEDVDIEQDLLIAAGETLEPV